MGVNIKPARAHVFHRESLQWHLESLPNLRSRADALPFHYKGFTINVKFEFHPTNALIDTKPLIISVLFHKWAKSNK